MSKSGVVRQVMAAGDPPIVGEVPFSDRREIEIRGRLYQQVEINYLGGRQFINVEPRDIVWDPHDCL